VLLEHGRSVRIHVASEFRQGRDPAITQLQHTVEHTVLAAPVSTESVTFSAVQFTEGGVLLEHGRSVRRHVEEELRKGRDPATTRLQHSVELTVVAKLMRHKNVTLSPVLQSTVVGRILGHGVDVQMAAVLEHNGGTGHVPTLPRPTVEDHALEQLPSQSGVIQPAVALMTVLISLKNKVFQGT